MKKQTLFRLVFQGESIEDYCDEYRTFLYLAQPTPDDVARSLIAYGDELAAEDEEADEDDYDGHLKDSRSAYIECVGRMGDIIRNFPPSESGLVPLGQTTVRVAGLDIGTVTLGGANAYRGPCGIDRSAILQAVARGWCHAVNGSKVLDPDLAEAITAEVCKVLG